MKRVLSRIAWAVSLSGLAVCAAGCDERYGGSYSDFAFGYLPSLGGITEYFESSYESFGGGFYDEGGYFEEGYEESYFGEGFYWDDWKKKNADRRK